jgi:hypothetical protein
MSTNQYPVQGDGQSTAGQPVQTMSQSRCFCSEGLPCAFCQVIDSHMHNSEYGNPVDASLGNMPYHSSLLSQSQIQASQYATPSNYNVGYSSFDFNGEDAYPSPPLNSEFGEDRECSP